MTTVVIILILQKDEGVVVFQRLGELLMHSKAFYEIDKYSSLPQYMTSGFVLWYSLGESVVLNIWMAGDTLTLPGLQKPSFPSKVCHFSLDKV